MCGIFEINCASVHQDPAFTRKQRRIVSTISLYATLPEKVFEGDVSAVHQGPRWRRDASHVRSTSSARERSLWSWKRDQRPPF